MAQDDVPEFFIELPEDTLSAPQFPTFTEAAASRVPKRHGLFWSMFESREEQLSEHIEHRAFEETALANELQFDIDRITRETTAIQASTVLEETRQSAKLQPLKASIDHEQLLAAASRGVSVPTHHQMLLDEHAMQLRIKEQRLAAAVEVWKLQETKKTELIFQKHEHIEQLDFMRKAKELEGGPEAKEPRLQVGGAQRPIRDSSPNSGAESSSDSSEFEE